jgi:hypothetical protein
MAAGKFSTNKWPISVVFFVTDDFDGNIKGMFFKVRCRVILRPERNFSVSLLVVVRQYRKFCPAARRRQARQKLFIPAAFGSEAKSIIFKVPHRVVVK